MAQVAADSWLVMDAALTLLRDAFDALPDSPWKVFDSEAYDPDTKTKGTPPYVVVHSIYDSPATGPMGAPAADIGRTVQVNVTAEDPATVRFGVDVAMQALCGANPREVEIEGRALMSPISHQGGRWLARNTETAGPTLFTKAEDFLFPTTPSS